MNRKMLLRIATAVGSLLTAVNPVLAQGTAFTYQGRLCDGASPANGSYDLTFALFSVVSGPGQAGSTVTNSAVAVSNGLFTVMLNFGNQFPGAARWLEIGVRTNGNGTFVTLIPRQLLTPTPYAMTAENLISAGLPGTYTNAVALNNTNNVFTGNGAGLAGVNAGTVGGLGAEALWQIGGNSNTTPGVNFLGTADNQRLEIKVNGTRALRLEPTAGDGNHAGIVNVVGGSPVNSVAPGVYGAVIGGGGAANYFGSSPNSILADFGFVGGGYQNLIQDNAISAVIGGGYQNTIGSFAYDATIAGGGVNTIQHDAFDSTIAGGQFNGILSFASGSSIGGGYFNMIQSSAYDSTIGGGDYNTIQANAQYGTIPGGNLNSVANSYGFAAGRRAHAYHQGGFVWGDSTDADIASTGNDEFVARASGGFYLYGAHGALRLEPTADTPNVIGGVWRQLRSARPDGRNDRRWRHGNSVQRPEPAEHRHQQRSFQHHRRRLS